MGSWCTARWKHRSSGTPGDMHSEDVKPSKVAGALRPGQPPRMARVATGPQQNISWLQSGN